MIDYSRSYSIDLAYYEVAPGPWADTARLDGVLSCDVTRDSTSEVFETARLSMDGSDMGERWVRCYATFTQGHESERHPMGCWLVQTPSRSIDATSSTVECVAYSSLHPLREKAAPLGTCYAPGTNCAEQAARICEEHGVAPVVASPTPYELGEWYVVPKGSSWLDVAKSLAAAARCELRPDSFGRVEIRPKTQTSVLRPSWTFDETDGSTLMPSASEQWDWFGLPNVCIVNALGVNGEPVIGRAENDDPESILSTASRGREVTLVVDEPDELKPGATQAAADALALRELSDASCVERVFGIEFSWCGVDVGDCVRIDYASQGLVADAVITEMRLTLGPDAIADATLKTTERLWRA